MQAPTFLLTAVLCLSSCFGPSVQECKEEYRRREPNHIACRPPNQNCKKTKSGLSRGERFAVLFHHNHWRGVVARGEQNATWKQRGNRYAPARNMLKLIWDNELASVAQARADQCTDAHGSIDTNDYLKRFTTKFNFTGENQAVRLSNVSFTGRNWSGMIFTWYSEIRYYPTDHIMEYKPECHAHSEHFSQMVWAATQYVGCGATDYTIDPKAELPYLQLYVCNYGPGGNVLTTPLYLPGDDDTICSSCPKGTACNKKTGLCELGKGARESQEASEEPAPDALHKEPKPPDEGRPTSARRNGADRPAIVRLPCAVTWGAAVSAALRALLF
ncbi:venom allergen 5-like [Amblyomma americanum]|uniref:SCP domain-containing protein n=1 Tax=Amblyomma americanum TaxID=6943 RepID=A0AAQ4EQ38_AMBAM